jgi:hypothetical protein
LEQLFRRVHSMLIAQRDSSARRTLMFAVLDALTAVIWCTTAGSRPPSRRCSGSGDHVHRRGRGPGERANAQLKYWRILHKLRCSPHRAGRLAKAIHVLQNYEAAAG